MRNWQSKGRAGGTRNAASRRRHKMSRKPISRSLCSENVRWPRLRNLQREWSSGPAAPVGSIGCVDAFQVIAHDFRDETAPRPRPLLGEEGIAPPRVGVPGYVATDAGDAWVPELEKADGHASASMA